ncbi:MAG: sialidase family protein [Pseudomonadota bacterium]
MISTHPGQRQRFGPADRLVAMVLVLAFALAGWKTFTPQPAADFAFASQQVINSKDRQKTPATLSPANQLSPDGRFHFDAQFVSAVPGQAVHAASVVELKNGDLRAVWFSGSREGARDVSIQTAILDSSTGQWLAESRLFERYQIERGLWRYVKKIGNPVIARAPDGSLLLWMVNVSLGGWAGSSITWARSTDEGSSWSMPRRLVTSPFLNVSTLVKGAPLIFEDGQIGLPVYHEFLTKFAEVIRLDASGRVVDKTRIPGSQTSLQPVVLVTGAKTAQVFMRSGNAQALMVSGTQDAGSTWSHSAAAAWPNPDSALAGLVTSTGGQWLALNPTKNNRETLALLQAGTAPFFADASQWIVESSATPQSRLSLAGYESVLGKELRHAGSNDEQVKAYVASARRQLCGAETCSQEFSYPYMLQSRDGYIHLVYTWHRTRIKHIRFDPRQPAMAAAPRLVLTDVASVN